MAGYNGYSMSNNAVSAYENGEKPKSKWTKTDMVDVICSISSFKPSDFKSIKKDVIANTLLKRSSWHHTSSRFNATDFYSIDEDKVEIIEKEGLGRMIEDSSKPKKKVEPDPIRYCYVHYLEWSGSRKRPKSKDVEEYGTINKTTFTSVSGVKKRSFDVLKEFRSKEEYNDARSKK